MDEFLVLLQAKLDEAKSKGLINSDIALLQGQLDKLKIQVELDPKAAQKLANDIGKLINQKIAISNINIDTNQAVRNAQQSGQQIGRQIQNGINSVIQKGNFTTEFTFSADKRNNVAKVAQEEFQKIANGIVTVKEQMSRVDGKSFLDEFIVNIKKANGEIESLTYRLKDMLDSQGKATGKSFQYIGGSINDNGVLKQFDAISAKADNLQTRLDKLKSSYSDINTSRPIKDSNNISALSQQYDKVFQAIENVRNADNTTFSSMVSNAQREITALESMVTQFRNAENVATQMKSVDISSGIAQAQERLGKLKADSTGFEQMTQTLRELDAAITNVGNKSSLDAFIDKLRVAETQLSRVKAETKSMTQANKIQLLSNGGIKNDYSTQIAKLEGNFRSLGLTEDEIQQKTTNVVSAFDDLKTRVNKPFDESNYQEIISLNDKLQKELIESTNEYTKLQSSTKGFVSMQQRLSKANTIEAWSQKNTAVTKDVKAANEAYIASLRDLNSQMTKMQFNEISDGFKKNENSMRALSKLGASFKDQMSQAAQSFTQWLSVSSSVMLLISKTKDAISEIKELDNILTKISKTSDMTSQQLKQLGMDAYDAASKYGRTASDYLLGVQEMARSGFYGEKGFAMAEQSLLAQSAGDMTADLANNYILATNAAYKLNGESDKLNAVLDGQNSITNRNSVAMADMATAMSEAGTVASSYRVSIEDLSSMIGTIESVTKLGGSEVGNAIKAILINLQNVTSDKIVDTLDAANASMTEFVNGAEKLRNPIDILRDLAKTFNQLDEDDPLRAEILTNIGQKYHAAKLGALLQNMEMFDKMLVDYSEGTGSALEESNKSAENLTGTLNKLHNSWTEFVNNIINSDGLKVGVNLINKLVEGATSLTSTFGSLGTIGLGAGLFAGVKNIGKNMRVHGFQIICFMF